MDSSRNSFYLPSFFTYVSELQNAISQEYFIIYRLIFIYTVLFICIANIYYIGYNLYIFRLYVG